MTPRFIYFDLGNVLLNFSHERQCRQMAEVAGVDWQDVRRVLYEEPLARDYESGRITSRQGYERFCDALKVTPDYERLAWASNDIFTINWPMVPLVGHLHAAGYRLGILSNTSPGHWDFVRDGRFAALLPAPFEKFILSFEAGVMKPDAAIYEAAARAAGVEVGELFYVDDIMANVEGARRAGCDAVQYVGTPELAAELRRRGLTFNH